MLIVFRHQFSSGFAIKAMTFRFRNFLAVALICLVVLIKIPETFAVCEVEDDLNSEDCNLEDLSTDALKAICDRIGLDIEQDIFPLFAPQTDDPSKHIEYTHEDYVGAVTECLEIEIYMEHMLDVDPEFEFDLENYVASMYGADSEIFDGILDVFNQSPELVTRMIEDLKAEDPEFYEDIQKELNDGETLADRLDILAEIVALTIAEHPEFLTDMGDVDDIFPGDLKSDLKSDEL